MILAGRDAVRRAFHSSSEMAWPTILQEYISTRVESIYDVTAVEDLEASGATLDTVRRAYLQGLKDSNVRQGIQSRDDLPLKEGQHVDLLIRRLLKQVRPEYVTDEEIQVMRQSVWNGYVAGCQDGRVPLGAVV